MCNVLVNILFLLNAGHKKWQQLIDDYGADALLNNLVKAAIDKIKELDKDIDEREAFLNKFLLSEQ